MRKILASSLVVLGLVGSVTAPTFAADTRYISVSSTGTVKVTPDTVRFNYQVSVLTSSNADALSQASAAAAKVRASLIANGITTQNIKSTTLTVFPEYNYTQDKGSVLSGYRATQSFEVIIRNASGAGAVVDAATAAGGDAIQITGVTPYVYDDTKASENARNNAVARAKAKAMSYAKLLGVHLGAVIYLEETTAPSPFPIMMAVAKSDSGATQIDLGQQDVTISINTKWSIR